MSIQTNSPSTNLGTSVSADEIAVLLGFADAAAMAAALGQFAVAGGTTNALTAAPATPWTSYSDGDKITLKIASSNTTSATLAVSGLAAKAIRRVTQAGIDATIANDLRAGHYVTLVYMAAADQFLIVTNTVLAAADIPSTLNATTFAGDVQSSGNYGLYKSANTGYLPLAGGNGYAQSQGAYDILFGNSHSTNPGDAHRYCGSAAGAAHSFYDKNGVEQLRVDEAGATGGTNRLTSIAFLTNLVAGYNSPDSLVIGSGGQTSLSGRLATTDTATSVGTSFTTIRSLYGAQSLTFATITGKGTILLEWDGTTLTKLAGAASLVVAGSAGAGETAFRASGGNLQAIVDTGSRNVSAGLAISH